MTTFRGSAFSGQALLITQGEFAVSDESSSVISTLLGSCVAVCLWDEIGGVGGMNHLLLANGQANPGTQYNLAGVAEMECLINGIIKLGGRRDRLQAKVFGGANMLGAGTGIGKANADFALDFLKQDGIACVKDSVGGSKARNVRFWPGNGKVTMKLVTETVHETETPKPVQTAGNELELF